MANQIKVKFFDQTDTEIPNTELVINVVNLVKLKDSFPGDLGVIEAIVAEIANLRDSAHRVMLRKAFQQIDANAIDLSTADWSNGAEFGVMKAWFNDQNYQDAEARGVTVPVRKF